MPCLIFKDSIAPPKALIKHAKPGMNRVRLFSTVAATTNVIVQWEQPVKASLRPCNLRSGLSVGRTGALMISSTWLRPHEKDAWTGRDVIEKCTVQTVIAAAVAERWTMQGSVITGKSPRVGEVTSTKPRGRPSSRCDHCQDTGQASSGATGVGQQRMCLLDNMI